MKHFLLITYLFSLLLFVGPLTSEAKGDAQLSAGEPIELNGTQLFDAYPNPASSYVTFSYKLAEGQTGAKLEVFNLIGEVVATVDLTNQVTATKLYISQLKQGIYFYRLSIEGQKSSVKKLIVR